MGTSQSSNGAPSGVPLLPPWADNPNDSNDGNNDSDNENSNPENDNKPSEDKEPLPETPLPIAPPARFKGARTNINDFARNGDKTSLKRGIGHYVRTGYGGSKTASRRLMQTTSVAGALYNVLSFESIDSSIDVKTLEGKTADEISDAIIEAVRPIDGNLDSEASRDSMKNAFSEILEKDENIDFLNLSSEQKNFIIERFVAGDVYKRFELDLGKDIIKNAPSPSVALSRLKEVKDYIRETVSSSFKKIITNNTPSIRSIVSVVKVALEDALHVFESYSV